MTRYFKKIKLLGTLLASVKLYHASGILQIILRYLTKTIDLPEKKRDMYLADRTTLAFSSDYVKLNEIYATKAINQGGLRERVFHTTYHQVNNDGSSQELDVLGCGFLQKN